jgi:alpha-beta hydrolase superfamily lysophospholipase
VAVLSFLDQRWLRRGAVVALLAFAALNVLAWRHAVAFTTFSRDGQATRKPEELGPLDKLWVLVTGPTVPRPRNRRTPSEVGLLSTTHVFPGHAGAPIEAWLVPAASSPGVVLMFHGHAAAKSSLLPAARAFHELGWSTLLVDFYGSGGSGGEGTSIGFHEAEDVAGAFRYAQRLGGRLVLYGQSMGAAAIMKAVHDASLTPAGVILEAPFDRFDRTVHRRFHALGVPAFPAAPLLLAWGGVVAGFDPWAFAPVNDAGALRAPLLLVHGGADPYITTDEARSIVAGARGPAHLVVLDDVGHTSFVGARPKLWRQAMRDFLAEVTTPAGP